MASGSDQMLCVSVTQCSRRRRRRVVDVSPGRFFLVSCTEARPHTVRSIKHCRDQERHEMFSMAPGPLVQAQRDRAREIPYTAITARGVEREGQ